MKTNISDKEIEEAFKNTNFGTTDFRRILEIGVFKRLVGYQCGNTLTVIMCQLGLTTRTDNVSVKGQQFCMSAYHEILRGDAYKPPYGALPASNHSAADCSAAFEWLRAEATKEGASPHSGDA